MPRDTSELHYIYTTSEAGQRICAGVVEVKVFDEQAIARLAEERIEACGGHGPSEVVSLKWPEEPDSVPGQWNVTGPSGQVFSFVGNTRNASVGVYPRGSEGEDLAGSHAGTEAQEESESYFATLGPWPFPRSKPEVAKESPDFVGMYDALAGWVISGGAEAAEGSVLAPFPLVPSDGEDVGEEVDVALDASFADYLQSLVAPLSKVGAVNTVNEVRRQLRELADQGVNPLHLERAPALLGADLVPVALERFPKAVLGDGATLHRQNLGLLRGGPGVAGTLGLEGARLANSVPSDLETPTASSLPNMSHARNVRRNPRGKNED